jgi:uroporphyrinogen-III synthase
MRVVSECPSLSGFGVLVTRPTQQAQRLVSALERHGARVLRFPLVEIGPAPDPNAAQSALAGLGEVDLVIFVSSNAARFAAALLPDLGSRIGRARVACVGNATADALEREGIGVDLIPATGTTSEALLAMDALVEHRVSGRRVAIVKGEGGRALLHDELVERGARVETIDVYRRHPPRGDLPAFLDRNRANIHMAVITSGEALARFAELAGMDRVRELALVLPSDRVLDQAAALGFTGPCAVARRVSDAQLAGAAVRLAARLDGTAAASVDDA